MYNQKITPSQISCCVNEHTSELEIYVNNAIAATISNAELDFVLAYEVLEGLGYEIETY